MFFREAGGFGDHLGLHVDTNAAHWRFCTAIIYLSDLDPKLSGGETVFPVALDPSLEGKELGLGALAPRTSG